MRRQKRITTTLNFYSQESGVVTKAANEKEKANAKRHSCKRQTGSKNVTELNCEYSVNIDWIVPRNALSTILHGLEHTHTRSTLTILTEFSNNS